MPFLHKLTKRLAHSRTFAFLLVGIAACSSGDKTVTAPASDSTPQFSVSAASTVTKISVSPSSAAGSLGQSAQFTATAYNASGRVVSGVIAAWTSSDSTIVSVTSTGFATAVGVGQATIAAKIGSASAQAAAAVSGDAIASITLSPSSAAGAVGQTSQYQATLTDAGGAVISGRRVLWASSNPAVVRVDSTGLATGVAAGAATISAVSAGKSANAAITVGGGVQTLSNPSAVTDFAIASIADTTATVSFTQVSDGAGQPASYEVRYAVAPISWGSASSVARGTCATPIVGTVVGAKFSCTINGLTQSTAYNFQIVPFRGTLNANAVFGPLVNPVAASTIASAPPPSVVASVTVSPGSASGNVGQSAQFSAAVKDVSGNTLTGQAVTWTSTNSAVVSVTSTGYATGTGGGSASIVATAGGKSGQAAITVTGATSGGTVNAVSVSPSSASLTVGSTQQLTATLKNLLGSILTGLTTTWASSNPAAATVNGSGLVTGVSTGSATITATSGGVSSSASISITSSSTAPPPSSGEPMPNFGTTIWQDVFGEGSTAAMLANYSIMSSPTTTTYADPTGGVNGGGALRIDWTKNSGTCDDQWAGIERAIPGAPTEIYIQYSVRYTPGFLFDWVHTNSSPCTGVAKKLFLVWSGDNVSRFLFYVGNLNLMAASDYEEATGANAMQNTSSPMSSAQFGDGNWHRVTFHIKQSSSTTATDGFMYGWIDGVLRFSKPNWASGSVGGWVDFKTPSTFNSGSPANQSEWMAGFTIWHP